MGMSEKKGFCTRTIHAGEHRNRVWQTTCPPIFQSAAFSYGDVSLWQRVAQKEAEGHIYSRNSNPTVDVLEQKATELESGEAGACFASGMAAISAVMQAFLRPGLRLLAPYDLYGGTYLLLSELLPRWGVDVQFVKTDTEAFTAGISTGAAMVYVETPTNPMLKILDIAKIGAAASAAGGLLVVDNTMATPFNQRPLALGADLVVHSATKYLSGHGDVLAGLVVGSEGLISDVLRTRELTGACLDAHAAWLVIRGLKTLGLRLARQNETAMIVAGFLENHPGVLQVHYPGLVTDPGHEVARRQMTGFGGVVTFEVRGGADGARRVVDALSLGYRAANLGGVETVYGPPALTSHVECGPAERLRVGIRDGLIRYAVGLEDAEDLMADLTNALKAI